MKKIFLFTLTFLAIFAAAFWVVMSFFPEKILPFMLDRQIAQQTERDDFLSDKEGITVFTIGTSSPFPGERAQTGTGIIINGHFFIFDVGPGVVQKAENIGLPLDRVEGAFISHWHSDHFMDLPYLINRSWVLGRENKLHVYGPEGLDTLMHAIDQLLHIENQYRVDHHGAELMDLSKGRGIPHEFAVDQEGTTIVYEQDGIRISAFDVNHEPIEPAVGYAIEYKGKKVVISGDTKKNETLIEMAKGADLLIHEVLLASVLKGVSRRLESSGNSRNARIVTDIQDYHSTPGEVAEVAQRAQVKQLILHHFVPPPDLKIIENVYRQELKAYKGPIHFAEDGDKFIIR